MSEFVQDYTEESLAVAVRQKIAANLSLGERECSVEPDEFPPFEVSKLYIAVIPNGMRAGKRHDSSGTVVHRVCGIKVAVLIRTDQDAPDRQSSYNYVSLLRRMNYYIGVVEDAIDGQVDVMELANEYLVAHGHRETTQCDGFTKPLYWSHSDPTPRLVGGEFFGQENPQSRVKVGLMRATYFGGAERYYVRNRHATDGSSIL